MFERYFRTSGVLRLAANSEGLPSGDFKILAALIEEDEKIADAHGTLRDRASALVISPVPPRPGAKIIFGDRVRTIRRIRPCPNLGKLENLYRCQVG